MTDPTFKSSKEALETFREGGEQSSKLDEALDTYQGMLEATEEMQLAFDLYSSGSLTETAYLRRMASIRRSYCDILISDILTQDGEEEDEEFLGVCVIDGFDDSEEDPAEDSVLSIKKASNRALVSYE